MLAPAATVLPEAGVHTRLLTVPALAVGTQVAAVAAPPPAALVQTSVRPANVCPGRTTVGVLAPSVTLMSAAGAAAGVMGGVSAQPAGVLLAVQASGTEVGGVPPAGSSAALLMAATPAAAAWGVTLMVNDADPPAAMPAGVVTVQTRLRPAANVPLARQLAAVAPAPGAALL